MGLGPLSPPCLCAHAQNPSARAHESAKKLDICRKDRLGLVVLSCVKRTVGRLVPQFVADGSSLLHLLIRIPSCPSTGACKCSSQGTSARTGRADMVQININCARMNPYKTSEYSRESDRSCCSSGSQKGMVD